MSTVWSIMVFLQYLTKLSRPMRLTNADKSQCRQEQLHPSKSSTIVHLTTESPNCRHRDQKVTTCPRSSCKQSSDVNSATSHSTRVSSSNDMATIVSLEDVDHSVGRELVSIAPQARSSVIRCSLAVQNAAPSVQDVNILPSRR